MTEESRREEIRQRLERMGYPMDVDTDGKLSIRIPLRKLDKKELDRIFYDGYKWSAYPGLNFRSLMEEMGRAEETILLEKLSDLQVCAQELDQIARIQIPAEEHLRQIYHSDIGVDTGDGGCDYTLNTLEPGYMGWLYNYGYHADDRASITWLTKQQGYKRHDLACGLHHINEGIHDLQGYIKSAANEICGELTSHNQLFFLLNLTLEQIMLLATCVQWTIRTRNWPGYVVLGKNTCTGFFDSSAGSGSYMGIEPERDVKLPIKYIARVFPDDLEDGYSVLTVYGSRTMWKEGTLKEIVLPKKFRRDMESLGFDRDPEKIFPQIENTGQV